MNKSIVIQNIITSYYDIGEGETVIIYLHGWKSTKESFLKCAELLKDDFRIIGVDLPGFGQTPWPTSAWDIDSYANFVRDFIQKLSLKNVVIAGHSMGGRVMPVLANDPEVKAVIALGAAGLPQREFKVKVLKSISRFLRKTGLIHLLPNVIRQKFRSKDFNESSGIQKETIIKILNQDMTEDIRNIQKPTLLIWGTEDDQSPVWMGYKWNELVKNSELRILENCGHFCERDFPELTAQYIRDFISRL
jgi:pimeloyl-ACP methyl ester carboxylesterase